MDGVYEEDPKINSNAVHDTLTYQEVISKDICVTDLTAIPLCQEIKTSMFFNDNLSFFSLHIIPRAIFYYSHVYILIATKITSFG